MRIFNFQFSIFKSAIIFLLLLTTGYLFASRIWAQSCSKNTAAEGLISSKTTTGNFGNVPGTCVVGSQALYVSFKIPTYAELKSIFFTQNKVAAKQTLPAGSLNASFTTDTLYEVLGDLRFTGSPPASSRGMEIFFVNGNFYIDNNMIYHTSDGLGGFVFVVSGNIYIASNVTQVDGVLISEGTICTAYTAPSGSCFNGITKTPSSLTINGSIISLNKTNPQPIKLVRNLPDNITASERVKADPKYLVVLKNLFSQTLTVTAPKN